ncbi:MAG: hypothetical protein NTY19_16685, partial [Planctomycetota bacterium]|nr:hypothetical protein [Planctomycetota bacterium]
MARATLGSSGVNGWFCFRSAPIRACPGGARFLDYATGPQPPHFLRRLPPAASGGGREAAEDSTASVCRR